jgi:hypothetical protein
MVMRPRHALAATAILTAVTLGSYRWVGNTLVRQVDTDRGGFATIADGPPSDQGPEQLPVEVTSRCGDGSW